MKRVFNSFLIVFVCVFGILGYRMQLEIMEMERPRLLTLAETEEEISQNGKDILKACTEYFMSDLPASVLALMPIFGCES